MYHHNRLKLISQFNKLNLYTGLFIIPGGKVTYEYQTDNELPFYQESNFRYLFGIEEPNVVGCLDLTTSRAWILIHESHSIWTHYDISKEQYQLDDIRNLDELQTYDITWHYTPHNKFVHRLLAEARIIKSEMELDLMRYVNKITCTAHIEVMKACTPGLYEYDLEALFKYTTYVNGPCRFQSYLPICASGTNSAILHYSTNTKLIRHNEIVLLDMGASYRGYRSDVTVTIPSNGRFTYQQTLIYNLVLYTAKILSTKVKPCITWTYLQNKAIKYLIKGLRTIGLIQGSFDELVQSKIIDLFFPHAIGHHIGLDTHDVPEISDRPFEPNMVIAIEPGIYFIPSLLEPANPYLNMSMIQEYWTFGGIRIENNLIVTNTGSEMLTKLPREISEIEAIMKK